jgi:hypothetical protein
LLCPDTTELFRAVDLRVSRPTYALAAQEVQAAMRTVASSGWPRCNKMQQDRCTGVMLRTLRCVGASPEGS